MKTTLTTFPELQKTLHAIADSSALISAGVPVSQANEITLSDRPFKRLKQTRSACCFAPLHDGVCSYCSQISGSL